MPNIKDNIWACCRANQLCLTPSESHRAQWNTFPRLPLIGATQCLQCSTKKKARMVFDWSWHLCRGHGLGQGWGGCNRLSALRKVHRNDVVHDLPMGTFFAWGGGGGETCRHLHSATSLKPGAELKHTGLGVQSTHTCACVHTRRIHFVPENRSPTGRVTACETYRATSPEWHACRQCTCTHITTYY